MLDSLMGRKFTAKCKPSIKCIKSRILIISKKKQAMLKFLKKDVADLLANGHQDKAFARMDGLIVDMNQISCYTMIEHFCDCILSQLSGLENKRECPQEVKESVATLIFAAARFSDLPELCDLRHVFTARYGNAMESSVNPEFGEKVATKSFPQDVKVKLMQEIAHELSVNWDYRSLEQKKSIPSVLDLSKKKDAPFGNAKQEATYIPSNGRNDAATNIGHQAVPSRIRSEPVIKGSVLKQEIHVEAKDIHVISSSNAASLVDPAKKTKATFQNGSENVKPCSTGTATPAHSKLKNTRRGFNMEDQHDVSSNTTLPIAPEGLDSNVRERQVGKLNYNDDKSNNMAPPVKPRGHSNGIHTVDDHESDIAYYESRSQKGLGSYSPLKQVVGPWKPDDDKVMSMFPPTKPKGYRHGTNVQVYHENDTTCDKSMPRQGTNSCAPQKQVAGLTKPDDDRFMFPLHVQRKGYKYEAPAEKRHEDVIAYENYKSEQGSDCFAPQKVAGLVNPDGDKVMSMAPPYFRSKGSKNGTLAGGFQEDAIAYDKLKSQQASDSSVPLKQVGGLVKPGDDKAINMFPHVRTKGHKNGTRAEDHDTENIAYDKLKSPQGLDSFAPQKVDEMVKSGCNKAMNMIPPYVKPNRYNGGSRGEEWHENGACYNKLDSQQVIDPNAPEKQATGMAKSAGNPSSNWIPPYVKPDANQRSSADGDRGLPNDGLVGDRKETPRSVRKKHQRPQPAHEHEGCTRDEPVSHRIPHGRRHGERWSSTAVGDGYDEEEMAIDRLLDLQ